jgi:hypothetical protein
MTPSPKSRPNTSQPNRARIGIQYMEQGNLIEGMYDAWVVLVPGWAHVLLDDADNWHSYPADVVYAVEWL